MKKEILEQIYEDQRKELEFRRTREQQIFTWSATVLIAIIGGVLVSSVKDSIFITLGKYIQIWGSIGISVFTTYSMLWQLRQRKLLRNHQRVLAKVAEKRGWFEEKTADEKGLILPMAWKNWGNKNNTFLEGSGKIIITGCLGAASIAIVLFAIPHA